MLKTAFELFTETTREEHPLSFLTGEEKCYAFAKGERGFYYITRSGASWKIVHVTKRNQLTAKVVWRRYAPEFPTPPTSKKLEYFESVMESKVKPEKKRVIVKDTQVKRFYTWERKLTYTEPGLNEYCSIVEAIQICKTICKDFDWTKPIKVRYLKQRKNYANGGFSYGSNIEIIDPNVQTVYHEIAHIAHTRLAKQLTGTAAIKQEAHGKEFAAIYAFLFKKYTPFKAVLESLTWEQIDVDMELYNKLVELYWNSTENKIDS